MQNINQWGQPIGPALDNWQPRPFPEKVTLKGQYCYLEPLNQSHGPALFEAHQQAEDTRAWTYLPNEAPKNQGEYFAQLEAMIASRDPLFFTVIDIQSGQPVGTLSLMRIDPKNGVLEVGHVHFSPVLQRSPLSTEAQWLLMKYTFDKLGYRRYEWKCDALNQPSRQAAARLGFQFEGIFRQAVIYKGRSRDTAWFSIIDSEWPQLNLAFREWLSPANFDDNGRQRHSLVQLRTLQR